MTQIIEETLRHALKRVSAGEKLSSPEATQVIAHLMTADLDEGNNNLLAAGLLCALKTRGETPEEIEGAARSLREHQNSVSLSRHEDDIILDTCGTGGDGANLINISTLTALVTSSLGVKVAKHGNRSVSSSCGSADLLEALDYPLHNDPEKVANCVKETNFGFLFAPHFHPALRNLANLRRSLGVRTLFNMLGPLVNPVGVTHQLIGVFDQSIVSPMATASGNLGLKRCLVVHGEEGLDELSPQGVTHASLYENGEVFELKLTPEAFGAAPVSLDKLAGGDAKHNARLSRELLSGERPEMARAVAMNAAAALWLAEKSKDFKSGYELAYDKLRSGEVGTYFENCKAKALDCNP